MMLSAMEFYFHIAHRCRNITVTTGTLLLNIKTGSFYYPNNLRVMTKLVCDVHIKKDLVCSLFILFKLNKCNNQDFIFIYLGLLVKNYETFRIFSEIIFSKLYFYSQESKRKHIDKNFKVMLVVYEHYE